jgi:hypothetical protein
VIRASAVAPSPWVALRSGALLRSSLRRSAVAAVLAPVAIGLLVAPGHALAEDYPSGREPTPAVLARHDYVLHCAGCHMMDGRGSATVPSLTGLAPLLAAEGGRAYLLRVPGVAQAPLSDLRLARLLDFVLASFSELRSVPSFTEGEVARARRDPLRDPVGARAALPGLEAQRGN